MAVSIAGSVRRWLVGGGVAVALVVGGAAVVKVDRANAVQFEHELTPDRKPVVMDTERLTRSEIEATIAQWERALNVDQWWNGGRLNEEERWEKTNPQIAALNDHIRWAKAILEKALADGDYKGGRLHPVVEGDGGSSAAVSKGDRELKPILVQDAERRARERAQDARNEQVARDREQQELRQREEQRLLEEQNYYWHQQQDRTRENQAQSYSQPQMRFN
jgi:hypothetical protein